MCAQTVREALQKVVGVKRVSVDLAEKRVAIATDLQVDVKSLIKALKSTGYRSKPIVVCMLGREATLSDRTCGMGVQKRSELYKELVNLLIKAKHISKCQLIYLSNILIYLTFRLTQATKSKIEFALTLKLNSPLSALSPHIQDL
jgi:copper chaperone CopZ